MAGSRGVTIGVCAVASALLLAGCGSKPADSGSGSGGAAATGTAFNACMVLDTGGVDDKSFNQSSWAGMQAAAQANPNIKISYVPVQHGQRLHAEPDGRGEQEVRHDRSLSAA